MITSSYVFNWLKLIKIKDNEILDGACNYCFIIKFEFYDYQATKVGTIVY